MYWLVIKKIYPNTTFIWAVALPKLPNMYGEPNFKKLTWELTGYLKHE